LFFEGALTANTIAESDPC